MNQEISKLIEMAFSEGEFTDAKRQIILRKATQLNEDIDLVEMAIENRISTSGTISDQNSIPNSHETKHFGIIDFEYYPFDEERDGYTNEDIDSDISTFNDFLEFELSLKIEKVEFKLDQYKDKPHEDDTCLVRFFVTYPESLQKIVEIHTTNLELFSDCPWQDNRDGCVSIYLITCKKESVYQLSMDKSIWQWERGKDSLVKVVEGHLFN